MSWIPTQQTLFRVMDSATHLNYQLQYQPAENETVTGYQWQMEPPDHPFTLSTREDGVMLSAVQLTGVFHPQALIFRDGNTIRSVSDWSELPSAVALVEFHPPANGQRGYTLTVTAHIVITDPLTGTETDDDVHQSWAMRVRHNYDSGKTLLENYIHASSNS
ncbi:hypothetical protein [Celerinatantimonas sp. YJH-8]|uniref:hypothetical protein n=1 Tax=Celerinatantimonas sp. YJH-8 TaxID=3228714 RepID=UPI0038CA14F1